MPGVMAESSFDMPACLEGVRRRDEEAARRLVEHLYPLVIKIVRSHLPRRTAEEDLAQTVFMRIFANLGQFRGAVPFEHWVSRIAVNACLNQLQSEKIRPELRHADLQENEVAALERVNADTAELDAVDHLAAREIVEKLLESLEPRDRLLLTLLHLEGRSVEEIRQITGWNKSLIKVRAFRARHRLKKRYARLIGTGEKYL